MYKGYILYSIVTITFYQFWEVTILVPKWNFLGQNVCIT